MSSQQSQRLAWAALLLASVATPLQAREDPATAAGRVVEDFYNAYLPLGGGLPEGAELDALAPHLSDRLRERIDAALAFRDWYVTGHPPVPQPSGPPIIVKPPFVDGDFFSSLFEGPNRFEVLATTRVAPATWHVWVRFEYEGEGAWTDTVVVTEHGDRLGIDDVVYSGGGPFNPPGRLTDRIAWRGPEGMEAGR